MATGSIRLPEGFELESLPEGFELEQPPSSDKGMGVLMPPPKPRFFEHFLAAEDRLLPPWSQATRREKAEKILHPATGLVTNVVTKPLDFASKLFWAAYKRLSPDEETQGMNLDQAVAHLAGRDPTGLENVLGGIAAFVGPVKAVKGANLTLSPITRNAFEWGAGEAIIQLSNKLAETIDPNADYGYEGATAVARSAALGAAMGVAGRLPVPKPAQVAVQSGIMGGTAAVEGGTPEEIITQAAIPAVFGIEDVLRSRQQMRSNVQKTRDMLVWAIDESGKKSSIADKKFTERLDRLVKSGGLNPDKVDAVFAWRNDNEIIGTVGDFLKSPKAREEFADVLSVPVEIVANPKDVGKIGEAAAYRPSTNTIRLRPKLLAPGYPGGIPIEQALFEEVIHAKQELLKRWGQKESKQPYEERKHEQSAHRGSYYWVKESQQWARDNKNRRLEYLESAGVEKSELKEIINKRIDETLTSINKGEHDPPMTPEQVIGRQYGLSPVETDRLLAKAEERYRELKVKPIEERKGQPVKTRQRQHRFAEKILEGVKDEKIATFLLSKYPKLLDLPDDIVFTGTISTAGRFDDKKNVIYINPARNTTPRQAAKTLIHELIHAYKYHRNKGGYIAEFEADLKKYGLTGKPIWEGGGVLWRLPREQYEQLSSEVRSFKAEKALMRALAKYEEGTNAPAMGEHAELAWLSRHRNDIEAILDGITSGKLPNLEEPVAAPPKRSRLALNNAIKNLGGSPDEVAAAIELVTGGKYSDLRKLPKSVLEEVADFVAQAKAGGIIAEKDYKTPVNLPRSGDTVMESIVDRWIADPDMLKTRRKPTTAAVTTEGKAMGWLKWVKELAFGKMNFPMWHFAKVLDAGDETGIASEVFSDNFDRGQRIETAHARKAAEMLLAGFLEAKISVKDAVKYSRMFDRKKTVLRAVFNHLPGDLAGTTEIVNFDLGNVKAGLSWGEVLAIYMLADQRKGLKHIKHGGLVIGDTMTGPVTDQQITDLRQRVQADPKLMILIDTFRLIDKTHWKPTINAVSRRMDGRDIATEFNWWGFDVYTGRQVGGKKIGWIKNGSFYNLDLTENRSIFKDRTHSRHPLRVHDAFEQFGSFEAAIARYVGMAEPFRIARTLLNHQPTYQKLVAKGYDGEHGAMVELLKRMQSPVRYDTVLDKLVNSVMPNIYRGLLNFSPTVWASNYSSVVNYGSYVNDGYMPHAFSPLKGVGYHELRSEILDHSDIAHARYYQGLSSLEFGVSRESDAMLQNTFGRSSYINATGDVIRESDMAAVMGGWQIAKAEFADAKAGSIGGKSARWWGAENVSAIQEGTPEYWNVVSRRAEYLWKHTQSTWDPYNRSLITSQPSKFARSFFLFRSAHEKALTMLADARNEYDNGRITAGEYANRVAYPLAGYISNAIIGLTVDALIFGVRKDAAQWILRVVTEPLQIFPVVGKVVQNELSAIVRAISGQKKIWVDESTLDSLPLEVTNKTLVSGYQLTEGTSRYVATGGKKGGGQIKTAVKNLVGETATLIGLPIGPVRKLERGYLAEEKVKERR